MFETIDGPNVAPTVATVLASAAADRATADQAEARLLVAACDWADLHPPESIHLAASFDAPPGSEVEEQIAGEGCPLVAEFSVAEFAAVLGMSTTAGKRLIGHSLELRHRLPRVWRRVQAGEVPAWRARRIAEATIHAGLTPSAAAYVDRIVAPFVERMGLAAIDRLVAEALVRSAAATWDSQPTHDTSERDPRHVTIHGQLAAYATTVLVQAEIDVADAHDLDVALARRAEELKMLGSAESLDVRRAQALGHLARHQTALDLAGDGHPVDPRTPAREVVLHVHLAAVVTGGELHLDRLAELEEGQRQVLLDQVRDWCSASHTRVTIRPVLDLATRLAGSGYTIPPLLREQVIQRDRTCAFPWCSRPARRCQIDHVVPYDPDDPNTTSDNLAALCTHHHRLKTHGAWRYTMTVPGRFTWCSPHGRVYLRDHTGTRHLPRP